MNNFKQKKIPEPVAPVNEAEAQSRANQDRKNRLSRGGTYATLFSANPIVTGAPKATLFGGA